MLSMNLVARVKATSKRCPNEGIELAQRGWQSRIRPTDQSDLTKPGATIN